MKKLKVCWVSAGVSSFMAGYLANEVDEWIYIDIDDQHPDSLRFIKDCEKVIGKEIQILKSKQYSRVEDCVLAFGGFRNAYTNFAPCTNWLKKRIRKEWEDAHKDCEITYVWGFDSEEKNRAERMVEENPQAQHEFPLIEKCLTKEDAHYMCKELGIKRPMMYELGYPNNNCVGCVKGGMGYWNKIRKDFPDVFEARAKLERKVGHSILKQCYLDELDPDRGNINLEIIPECGMMCYFATNEELKG